LEGVYIQYLAADGISNDDVRLAIELGTIIYKAGKKFDKWLETVILNKIYIKNDSSKTIYVAIRFAFDKKWITKAWFKFAPGEKALILSLYLDYRIIYLHAHSLDGSEWGKGDYKEKIDGRKCKFTEVDIGLIRGKYTYTYA
jgi:hypothetical protein